MKLKKYKNIIFTIIFVIFTVLSIIWSVDSEKYEEPEKVTKKEITKVKKTNTSKITTSKVKVDIKGEIANPGVYELTVDNNVNDVINLAGGLTDKSDTSNINLSKKLLDEMVIIVYSKEEISKMNKTKEVVCPKVNDACIKDIDESAKLNEKEIENVENTLININTATKEELETLNGIGSTKAQAIVEYRSSNGNFEKIEDIKNVSGIGEAAFEKIKDQITV